MLPVVVLYCTILIGFLSLSIESEVAFLYFIHRQNTALVLLHARMNCMIHRDKSVFNLFKESNGNQKHRTYVIICIQDRHGLIESDPDRISAAIKVREGVTKCITVGTMTKTSVVFCLDIKHKQ